MSRVVNGVFEAELPESGFPDYAKPLENAVSMCGNYGDNCKKCSVEKECVRWWNTHVDASYIRQDKIQGYIDEFRLKRFKHKGNQKEV